MKFIFYFIYYLPTCGIYLLSNNENLINFSKIREIRYVIYNIIATISTLLVLKD